MTVTENDLDPEKHLKICSINNQSENESILEIEEDLLFETGNI